MSSRFKRQRVQPASKPPAPSSADFDDYLSAAFVTEQPQAHGIPNADHSKRARHLADPDNGKVLSKKDIAKKMDDTREEGLQRKIGEDNTGFKLLIKLGYKGGGLGKDGGGAVNPLAPEIKQGRAGLGKDSETKRRKDEAKERAKKKAARAAQQEVERRANFRLAKSAQFEDRRLQQELNRAQRLVESLDDGDGRPWSIMWPEELAPEDSDRELPGSYVNEWWVADENRSSKTHASAARAKSDSDGHKKSQDNEGLDVEGLGPGGGLREEWDMMTLDEKLASCLAYLRASHYYCMYCACKYGGAEDLQASCPGPNREDHDEEEL